MPVTDFPEATNTGDGVPTTHEYGNDGGGTSRWHMWVRKANGSDASLGATTDAAVTNPATAGTIQSVLRGILTYAANLANLAIAASGLLKAEDAVHASGDAGVMTLAVRRDTAAASSGTTGDYEPLSTDSSGRLRALVTRDTVAGNPAMVANVALAASLVVKASPGTLHGLVGYSTTTQFLQVHDATSAPADTAVPELVVPITAGVPFNIPLPGHVCTVGIVVCNSSTGPTKTIGGADTWVTAYYD